VRQEASPVVERWDLRDTRRYQKLRGAVGATVSGSGSNGGGVTLKFFTVHARRCTTVYARMYEC
jgi:hypothetical protein